MNSLPAAQFKNQPVSPFRRGWLVGLEDEGLKVIPAVAEGQSGTMVLYHDESDKVHVSALLKDKTLWMTQVQMADLFEVKVPAVSRHIGNIYEDGELAEEATASKMEIVRQEGNRTVSRTVACYNLDMVIAVGYRVNSKRAAAFRIWATNILREYIIKGFTMDNERLKHPEGFPGEDDFREMLERIGDIRSSERRPDQKITDIYSQCSVDYDKNSPVTRRFFAQVHKQLHGTICRRTAAEIICSQSNMGLQRPEGKGSPSEGIIAENCPDKEELSHLNRLAGMCLDFAENQARKHIPMTMADWGTRLGAFLQFNEEELLTDHDGRVTRAVADAFAVREAGFSEKS